MEKHTAITYTAFRAGIHFCPDDADIIIRDHSSHETVTIQGLDPEGLRGAITCYVHNLSLIKDDPTILDWYNDLKSSLEDCIKRFEATES